MRATKIMQILQITDNLHHPASLPPAVIIILLPSEFLILRTRLVKKGGEASQIGHFQHRRCHSAHRSKKVCFREQIFASEDLVFEKTKKCDVSRACFANPRETCPFSGARHFRALSLKKILTRNHDTTGRPPSATPPPLPHPAHPEARRSPENIHRPSETPLLPAPPQQLPCRSTYGCCGWVPAPASACLRIRPPPSASAHPVRSEIVRPPKPRQTRAASRKLLRPPSIRPLTPDHTKQQARSPHCLCGPRRTSPGIGLLIALRPPVSDLPALRLALLSRC